MYDGFCYVQARAINGTIHWQCDQKKICKARAHSSVDVEIGDFVDVKSEHTHAPDASLKEILKAVDALKKTARSTQV